jgi:predicted AAA+ superfamily ATPase
LGSQDFALLKEYAAEYELLAIDEAQQAPNVGMGLKILVDENPNIHIVATGSSSFDLSQTVGEPLTGRKTTVILYPVSQLELRKQMNAFELKERLEDFLVFGSYPEIVTAKTRDEKMRLLYELVDSYLLKDVLSIERIRAPKQLNDLLKLLALQVGNLVSLNELAMQVQLDVKTVGKYLDILEKAFVIKRVGGFSRNLRNEVIAKSKYYFLDNGIRNGVISQFNGLNERTDDGVLFENFVMMERLKMRAYKSMYGDVYFWRMYGGKEIDIIEDREGKLFGYEVTWSTKDKKRPPKEWTATYRNATYAVVTRENYVDFVT